MYRLFATFGGLIVIVLFLALITPYFINWAGYKRDFEREASRVMGQEVEVLGKVDIRLLPLPSITFSDLAIGTNPDGTPIMTIDQFAANIELMPLLKGEVRVVKLKLVRPRINLHVNKGGVPIWGTRQKPAINPEQIRLENFTLVNAEIKIHGLAGGRTLFLEQLNGRLSAKSLYGPWLINASGYVEKKRTHIKITTGHLQNDGSIRISLMVKQPDLSYSFLLDGPVKISDDTLYWDGNYEFSLWNRDNSNVSGKPIGKDRITILPVFSKGTFRATPQSIGVHKFRLEVGARKNPYVITGTGSAQISQTINFQIQADGKQIDLNYPGPSARYRIAGDNSAISLLSIDQRFEILRHFLEKIPIPAAEGVIDLYLPAIIANNAIIREISMIISPNNQGWEIKKFNAILPGNTKFETKGKLVTRQAFSFTGTMLAASRQPSSLAAWLGKDKNKNPLIHELRSAGFTANITASDNQISLENLKLILNTATLNGKLKRVMAKNGKSMIIAQLTGKEINLEDLWASLMLMTGSKAPSIINQEIDVDLNAERLTGFGITAKSVKAKFQISDESVSIHRLDAFDFLGVRLASSGRLDNIFKQPNGRFELVIKAQDSSKLLNFIQSQFPDNKLTQYFASSAQIAENLDLIFRINIRSGNNILTETSSGQTSILGVVGNTKINIVTNFEGILNSFNTALLDISATFENKDSSELLMQLGASVLPIDVSSPLKVTGSFTGTIKNGFNSFMTAQMPNSSMTASGMIYPTGNKEENAAFRVTFGSQDIGPLLLLSGTEIALQTWDAEPIPASFSGDFRSKKNKIILSRGKGQIKNAEFSVDLDFEKNTTSNHRIAGKLTATTLPLSLLTHFVFTRQKIESMDLGENWSRADFGQAVLQGVDGKIELNIGNSDFGIGEFAKELKGQLLLVDGAIHLNEIKGKWLGGNFTTNLLLANNAETASFSTQFKFNDINAQSVAKFLGNTNFVDGSMDITGNLEGSGHNAETIVLSLSGNGIIDLKNATVFGLHDAALKHVFKTVDRERFEITNKNVLPILTQAITNGNASIVDVSTPYVVVAGKVQANNITIKTEKTNMVGSMNINLARQTVNSELLIRFDPGREWVSGADPQIAMIWQGDFKSLDLSIDVQPLSSFLLLRRFEQKQRQADLLQASILEEQRFNRDITAIDTKTRYRRRLQEKLLYRQRQVFLNQEESRLHKWALKYYWQQLELEKNKHKDEGKMIEHEQSQP